MTSFEVSLNSTLWVVIKGKLASEFLKWCSSVKVMRFCHICWSCTIQWCPSVKNDAILLYLLVLHQLSSIKFMQCRKPGCTRGCSSHCHQEHVTRRDLGQGFILALSFTVADVRQLGLWHSSSHARPWEVKMGQEATGYEPYMPIPPDINSLWLGSITLP